jgi:protein-L-isoaspartate(D-aspartate) O-methyltransferase
MPADSWCQLNIQFHDRLSARHLVTDVLGPALLAAEADGQIRTWWYLNKQPWPLRYVPAGRAEGTGDPAITGLLADLLATGQVAGWAHGIYEPETHAFGGDAAMDAAHELFHQDSHHLLTYDPGPAAGRLGRAETAVLLTSAMMRSASLDSYEQGDVWAKVSALRPAPPSLATDRAQRLAAAMRRLITADARLLSRPTGHGALSEHSGWVAAFERTGQTLAGLSRQGRLTRGLRAVIAHHVIFHANRAGLSLADQSALSALAIEVTMEQATPPSPDPAGALSALRSAR